MRIPSLCSVIYTCLEIGDSVNPHKRTDRTKHEKSGNTH